MNFKTVTSIIYLLILLVATSCTFSVQEGKKYIKSTDVSVNFIELNYKNIDLTCDDTLQLFATISPQNATNKNITWTSSNENVVTVSNSGLVTAHYPGNVLITAKTESGYIEDSCYITVKSNIITVTQININVSDIYMNKAETYQMYATIIPNNATNKNLLWFSSDESIASISNSGLITAHDQGIVFITVQSVNGKINAYATVNVSQDPNPIEKIELNYSNLTLYKDESQYLNVNITPTNVTNSDIIWSTSDGNVAIVSNSGCVTAVGRGSAVISATSSDGKISDMCDVTVEVQLTGVQFNKTNSTMIIGGIETIYAIPIPADAEINNITWYSSNEYVATVSQNGVVTAQFQGEAYIRANIGLLQLAECYILVKSQKTSVTEIILSKEVINLSVGDSELIDTVIIPLNSTNQNITWSSSNDAVVTVSNSGLVTAINPGSATIKVTTEDGNKTDSCSVTVLPNTISVTSISLNKESTNIISGNTEQLTATINPINATNKNISWSSSNNTVASVSNSGFVTTHNQGTVTITATTEDGNKTDSCSVTVLPNTISVTSISLNKESTNIISGNTEQLTATINPINATNKNISWSSSNNTVASVSNSGFVTTHNQGTVTITATTEDGNKTDSCSVTVLPNTISVTSISLNKESTNIISGNTEQLTATINPINATNKNILWSSSNDAVVTVSNSGLVTAINPGSATITVTTEDGNKTDSCIVNIEDGNDASLIDIKDSLNKIAFNGKKYYSIKYPLTQKNVTLNISPKYLSSTVYIKRNGTLVQNSFNILGNICTVEIAVKSPNGQVVNIYYIYIEYMTKSSLQISYSSAGEITSKSEQFYEYNENDDLIKKRTVYRDKNNNITFSMETTSDYIYENNNIKLKSSNTIFKDSLGVISSSYTELAGYEYDLQNEVTIQNYKYTNIDKNNNITSNSETNTTYKIEDNRWIGYITQVIQKDGNGIIKYLNNHESTVSLDTNTLPLYSEISGLTYQYDSVGNLTSQVDYKETSTTTYDNIYNRSYKTNNNSTVRNSLGQITGYNNSVNDYVNMSYLPNQTSSTKNASGVETSRYVIDITYNQDFKPTLNTYTGVSNDDFGNLKNTTTITKNYNYNSNWELTSEFAETILYNNIGTIISKTSSETTYEYY